MTQKKQIDIINDLLLFEENNKNFITLFKEAGKLIQQLVALKAQEYLQFIPQDLHNKFFWCFDNLLKHPETTCMKDVLDIIEAFFSKEGKPELCFTKNSHIDLYIPDTVNKELYEDLLFRVYEVTKKGVGKGEVLTNFLFSNNFYKNENKLIDHIVGLGDNDENGEELKANLEKKAGSASHKATSDASFRGLDPALKKFIQPVIEKDKKISGAWLDIKLDDQNKILSFVKFVEGAFPFFDEDQQERLVEYWKTSDCVENRRVVYTSIVLDNYMKMHNTKGILYSKLDKRKKEPFSLTILVNPNDTEFLQKNLNCKPQRSRGKGTQALGDGYCDIELR